MDRLLNELEEYLSSNTIQYSLDKENYTVFFEGKSYEVFEPNEDGYFFSEDFRWDCERTEEDGYIFRLGGVWYTLDKGKENEPKLNRVKWRGQSEMAGLSTNFLGVHGSFELLNGTGLYPDWVKKAKFLGIERLGIVEKATLAGALKFQNACKAEGIIPVFGLEVPVKDEKKDIAYTYKVYAKNEKGWQHLLALNKVLNCGDGGKFVSPKDISEHVSDVYIVFDPKTIQFEDVPILLKSKPNVFWQVDTVEYTKNDRDTSYLMNFEKFYKSKMKPVAIFDAYYIEPEYAILREVVNKIDGKVNYKSGNQYFKDEATYMEELLSLFGDSEKGEEFYMIARSNADMIAESCNFEIPTDTQHLPRYEMTKEEKKKYTSNEDMFDSLIYEGLENKPELLEDYSEDVLVERIERESKIIKFGDVVDYFLILRDIVNWCKKNNILLGAGRGCFVPGTKVYMADRTYKNIEDVKVGDIVKTIEGKSAVKNVFCYDVQEELVHLEFEGGFNLTCTKDHKIHTQNRGYVPADEITEEDDITFTGMCVYKMTCKSNGKIYIGCTSSGVYSRLKSHKDDSAKSRSIKMYKDLNKYGLDGFEVDILEYASSLRDLQDKERKWIAYYKEKSPKLVYNIGDGGFGGDNYKNNPNMERIRKRLSIGVKNSERWTEEKRRVESIKMRERNPMRNPVSKRKCTLSMSKTLCTFYILKFSLDGELIGIYDSPYEAAGETFKIFSGSSCRVYKDFIYLRRKKNEITKEELYKLFGKGLRFGCNTEEQKLCR